jgi:hypothetical protein
LVAGQREWRLPQPKQSCVISLTEAFLTHLLILICFDMLMPSFTWFSASQTDNWCSIFNQQKKCYVTEILDIWVCVQGGFLRASQLNTKLTEMPFLPSCWHIWKLRERHYCRLLHQLKPRSIMLNHREKSNLWNGAILGFWGRTVSLGGKIMISIFWDCEGAIFVDVMPRGRDSQLIQQNADRSGKCF